jgi:hypothetical protein
MKAREMMAVIVALLVQATGSSPKAQSRSGSLFRAALVKLARLLLTSTSAPRSTRS